MKIIITILALIGVVGLFVYLRFSAIVDEFLKGL